jgi:hypothetical protein
MGPGTRSCFPTGGRHPEAYHAWVLERRRDIDEIAQCSQKVFLELYEERVKRVVRENPAMLRKSYYEARG